MILENRTIYLSKNSVFVKMVTIGTLVILFVVTLTLMTTSNNYGIIGDTSISILIIGTVIYFYANSLEKIILDKDSLTLKRKVGQIIISKSDILSVHKLEYSDFTMTYGGQGIFSFIGSTMDNSVSLVKYRKKMLRIVASDKKYIISPERPDELVIEIKRATRSNKSR